MKVVSLLVLCLSVLVAVAAANQLSAQTTTIGSDGTTTTTIGNGTTSTTATSGTSVPGVSASPATSTAPPVVLNLVEITRMVPAGTTAVTAFTVPAGQMLIVTDVVVTNTGDTPTCGAAINRAGAAAGVTPSATTGGATTAAGSMPLATGTTTTGSTATGTPTTGTTSATTGAVPGTSVQTLAGTITQSDSSITGPLCVAARTSTPLPFSTGIEFGPGQTLQLMNVPDTTTTTGTAPTATTATGSVGFHLRGMLVAA
jgi:hypothetical protein